MSLSEKISVATVADALTAVSPVYSKHSISTDVVLYILLAIIFAGFSYYSPHVQA